MLDKTDLSQIRKIIREEVETEVSDARQTLETLIRLTKMELKSEISDVDDRLKNVQIATNNLEKDMKIVKKDVREIHKTINTIVKNYDEGDTALGKRVTKIETHLQI